MTRWLFLNVFNMSIITLAEAIGRLTDYTDTTISLLSADQAPETLDITSKQRIREMYILLALLFRANPDNRSQPNVAPLEHAEKGALVNLLGLQLSIRQEIDRDAIKRGGSDLKILSALNEIIKNHLFM
jgi:hypothetical protein